MCLNNVVFARKHISDCVKAYLFDLLLNMSSSQYNGAFSLDSMGFSGIPQGFPVTINRYKGISQFVPYSGPWQ